MLKLDASNRQPIACSIHVYKQLFQHMTEKISKRNGKRDNWSEETIILTLIVRKVHSEKKLGITVSNV